MAKVAIKENGQPVPVLQSAQQRFRRRLHEISIRRQFEEFGIIRQVVREAIKEVRAGYTRKKRRSYDRSTFYIGKNTCRLSFYGLKLSSSRFVQLMDEIQADQAMKERNYNCFATDNDLHIYLRRA